AALLGAAALALPNANAWAAATSQKAVAKTKLVTATKSFTGSAGTAGRWGDVQVTIVVRKTKTVKRKILSVKVPVYPDHTDRSVFINQQALPILIQETVQAQSTGINLV